MPVISRISGKTNGWQAKAHKHCGECSRSWCICHRKASQYFSDAKNGGKASALKLARRWCRDAAKENSRRAGSKRKASMREWR